MTRSERWDKTRATTKEFLPDQFVDVSRLHDSVELKDSLANFIKAESVTATVVALDVPRDILKTGHAEEIGKRVWRGPSPPLH